MSSQAELLNYRLNKTASIRQAIKKMDENGQGIVVIENDQKNVVGIVTDGDLRRAILQGIDLNKSVQPIVNANFHFLSTIHKTKDLEDFFTKTRFRHALILEEKKLVDLITKEEFLKNKKDFPHYRKLNLPVIIMAGGQGKRLEPFTHILPKPLIPIGKKTMIQVIMDEYAKYGIKDFHISVNFKKNLIKAYFADENLNYDITYIEEDQPLGTAGALKLLDKQFDTPFFVSNCDILIKEDYSKIVDFHKNGNFDLTLVASMLQHTIPYGICKLHKNGQLKMIEEKPTIDYLANTGMYLLNPDVVNYIPDNKFYHITNLIADLQKEGKKIGVFPVSEKAWLDVGEWNELFKIYNKFSTVK